MIWYSFRSPDYEMCLLRLQFLYVFWRLHPLVQLEEFTLVWKYVAVRTSRGNIGYTNYIERCCSCEIQHVVALGLTRKPFFEAPIIEGEFQHFKLKYKLGWTINDFLWRQGIHQVSPDRWFSHISLPSLFPRAFLCLQFTTFHHSKLTIISWITRSTHAAVPSNTGTTILTVRQTSDLLATLSMPSVITWTFVGLIANTTVQTWLSTHGLQAMVPREAFRTTTFVCSNTHSAIPTWRIAGGSTVRRKKTTWTLTEVWSNASAAILTRWIT